MGKRSLKASEEGQVKAKNAFARTRWTQEQLAFEIGLSTRQSVWKFFTGRPIERNTFIDLCFYLNLEWEEIADLPAVVVKNSETSPTAPTETSPSTPVLSEEDWVEKLRQHLQPSITKQCGLLQSSLDLGHPLPLEKLYTPIRIIPQLRHKQWLDLDELQTDLVETPRLHLTQTNPQSLDALEIINQTDKILLLGKPGAGKTTFLKYVTQQCISGAYQPESIPIFVALRHHFSPEQIQDQTTEKTLIDLFAYLTQLLSGIDIDNDTLKALLEAGKFLLLIDGLDEISSSHIQTVIREIQSFTQKYPENSCIITTRMTSDNYYLPGFYNVEVDDFSPSQIKTFAQKWFAANLPTVEAAEVKTKQFLEALDAAENQPLKELMGTPILLSLLCSVFLARSSFPKQRAKLYQAGLDILLQKWDRARGIQRDNGLYQLSTTNKLLLLGKIAATTFEKGNYFFEKTELLDIISSYMETLDIPTIENPREGSSLEAKYLASESLLQSIQTQHGLLIERAQGIYSFSHLTFQEYLTARHLIYQSTAALLPDSIHQLAAHTLNPAWHEVIRLTANMIPNADLLLRSMALTIQAFIQPDSACQQFLAAVAQKSESLQSTYKLAAVRAFYVTLFSDRDLSLATALDPEIARELIPDMALDLGLARAFNLSLELIQLPNAKALLNLIFALELDRKFKLCPEFESGLAELKQQLPQIDSDFATIQCWCEEKGESWIDSFRDFLIKTRQIAQIRLLTPSQRKLLYQFYQLTVFLVKCYQENKTTTEFSEEFVEGILLPA